MKRCTLGLAICAAGIFGAIRVDASTIYSTFGPGQTYDSSNYLITGSGSTGYYGIAAPFQPSATGNFLNIDLALGYLGSGTDSANIILASDNAGLPGTAIETIAISGVSGAGSVFTYNSVLNPLLSSGTKYWIELMPTSPANTGILWHLNSIGAVGVAEAQSYGGNWFYQSTGGFNPPAFDINSTASSATPEPSTLFSMLGGTLVLAGARSLKKRT